MIKLEPTIVDNNGNWVADIYPIIFNINSYQFSFIVQFYSSVL